MNYTFPIPDINPNLPNKFFCSSILSFIYYYSSSYAVLGFYLHYSAVKCAIILTPMILVASYFLIKCIIASGNYRINVYTVIIFLLMCILSLLWLNVYRVLSSAYTDVYDLAYSYGVISGISVVIWIGAGFLHTKIDNYIENLKKQKEAN